VSTEPIVTIGDLTVRVSAILAVRVNECVCDPR
jgi:hypothetical protein